MPGDPLRGVAKATANIKHARASRKWLVPEQLIAMDRQAIGQDIAESAKLLEEDCVPRFDRNGTISITIVDLTHGALQIELWARLEPVGEPGPMLALRGDCYSAIRSPEPPNSAGKALIFGRPSRIGSTVSA